MFKILFAGALLLAGFVVNFYSFRVKSVDDTEINFNDFYGKKVLIVNIATSSNQANQLSELQHLYSQYKDSFVIIAFPCNSFGNEPKTNEEIQFLLQQDSISFPVAGITDVKGSNANIVYRWLRDKMQNEVHAEVPAGDFYKYLINKKGKLIAVYDSSISPVSQTVIHDVRFKN